jgi:acetamidase/formamidase
MRVSARARSMQYGWDNSRAPALVVPSGTEIELELRDASDGQITRGATADSIPAMDRSRGNPLSGPIFVESAHPGAVLQVDILQVAPSNWGWTGIFPGFGLLAEDFPRPALLEWDLADGLAQAAGLRLPQAPFCGVIGVCPREPGTHSAVPPRDVGGNMDTKQLRPGATLYLPIEVEGALLGIGDTHALQGDGEVCGSALETSSTTSIRVSVRDDLRLRAPEFEAPSDGDTELRQYATTGIGEDLYASAQAAVRRMIEYLMRRYGFSAETAYMLCSVLVDLKISEVVDRPNWVVTAFWPLGLVERRSKSI